MLEVKKSFNHFILQTTPTKTIKINYFFIHSDKTNKTNNNHSTNNLSSKYCNNQHSKLSNLPKLSKLSNHHNNFITNIINSNINIHNNNWIKYRILGNRNIKFIPSYFILTSSHGLSITKSWVWSSNSSSTTWNKNCWWQKFTFWQMALASFCEKNKLLWIFKYSSMWWSCDQWKLDCYCWPLRGWVSFGNI